MAKTGHLSFRIADATLKLLEERAELANEPKTRVVERYVEEALHPRDDDVPHLAGQYPASPPRTWSRQIPLKSASVPLVAAPQPLAQGLDQ
jgi:hypothetical protein